MPYISILLAGTPNTPLPQLIYNYLEYGDERTYRCEHCGQVIMQTTFRKLAEIPDAIPIYIVWQVEDDIGLTPEEVINQRKPLNIRGNLNLQTKHGEAVSYSLIGGCQHVGSRFSGHYICHLKFRDHFYTGSDADPFFRSTEDHVGKCLLYLYTRI